MTTERNHGRTMRALLAELEIEAAQADEFDLSGEFISRLPEQLQEYWTIGEGGAKIRWCTPGAFERGRRALRKYVTSPDVLDGLVANLYRRACGRWPGERKD